MSFRLWINWTRQNKALILKKCLSGSKIHPLLRRYQGLHMSDVLISVFCGYFFFINSPVRTLKAGLDGEVGYCEVNLVTAYFSFKYFLQMVSFLFTPAPSLFLSPRKIKSIGRCSPWMQLVWQFLFVFLFSVDISVTLGFDTIQEWKNNCFIFRYAYLDTDCF